MSEFEKLYYEDEGFWEGEMLHDAENQMRIERTAALIPAGVSSLADIGCGNGVFVNYLKEHKPELELMAVDRSQTALKYVNTPKMSGDVADIPLQDNSFDCVTCLEVVEHLPIGVYEKAFSELARIAKKYIIISVPYMENLEERHNQCPSCKTIFNHDLHLRSFGDETMKQLLISHGYECVSIEHLGESVTYKGHHTFRKLFYKEQFKQWNSPICPLCGFTEKKKPAAVTQEKILKQAEKPSALKSSVVPILSSIPKLLWPKKKRYYWVMALYRKK